MNHLKELVSKVNHLNVLYVEDEQEVREESTRFFKRFFPSLKICSNGEEAWKLFKKESFDLVITDLKMPIMNGHELIKKIKQTDKKTVTLLISGISITIDEEIQADYKLGKPVNYSEFLDFLELFIQKHL